jgi:hypothetical protein
MLNYVYFKEVSKARMISGKGRYFHIYGSFSKFFKI